MTRHENTREHYRIVYPVAARPLFREFGVGDAHVVLDCSEKGVRYRSARGLVPPVGALVEGTIIFADGEEERVAGIAVRTHQGEVALHLTAQPIPFQRIMEQQRFLRQNFPLNELMA